MSTCLRANLCIDQSPQSWGGGTDSYFEYLIKYARMTNNGEMLWVERWKTAIESSLTSLAVVCRSTSHVGVISF